jgi:hypothetical protein
MKIRIKGNSIRVRLSRSEVDKLATEGIIEEFTEFNDRTFGYKLKSAAGIETLSADFNGNDIIMQVSDQICKVWAGNEVVGYSETMTLKNGNSLSLLLEKDFKCIDAAVTEDQSDNFENPLLTC